MEKIKFRKVRKSEKAIFDSFVYKQLWEPFELRYKEMHTFNKDQVYAFGSFLEAEIIGSIALSDKTKEQAGSCQITSMAVLRRYRSMEIGSHLFENTIKKATYMGYKKSLLMRGLKLWGFTILFQI